MILDANWHTALRPGISRSRAGQAATERGARFGRGYRRDHLPDHGELLVSKASTMAAVQNGWRQFQVATILDHEVAMIG